MRAVIQRVNSGMVRIDGSCVGAIGKGVVILLGVKTGDTEKDAGWMAEKCAHLRIFENGDGKFDESLLDVGGEALVVSQFTLYGDCRKGRRPSFSSAADPETAKPLYETFVRLLRKYGLKVETGIFAAKMQVELINEGPVTLIVDSEKGAASG